MTEQLNNNRRTEGLVIFECVHVSNKIYFLSRYLEVPTHVESSLLPTSSILI